MDGPGWFLLGSGRFWGGSGVLLVWFWVVLGCSGAVLGSRVVLEWFWDGSRVVLGWFWLVLVVLGLF